MKFKLRLTRFTNGRRYRAGAVVDLKDLGLSEPRLDLEPADDEAQHAMAAYVATLSPSERAARELEIKRTISVREPNNAEIAPERLVAVPGWGVARSYIEQQKVRNA